MPRNEIKSNFNVVKGIVVDVNDPSNLARAKVRIPCYHGSEDDENHLNDDELPWAQSCLQRNNAFTVGDTVWITFEGGDTRYPVIIGQLGSTANFPDDIYGMGSGGYGIVGGEYDITIDGHTYHVGGSTLAEMGVSIITINEGGDYSAYNGHDVNGPSAGLMGFHAQALFDCMKKIRERNPSGFDSICNSAGASSVISHIQSGSSSFLGGSSSNNITVPKESAVGQAIYNTMNSEEGKAVQLEEATRLVQNYIDMGTSAGVTDNSALLFLADISNQGPYMTICKQMRASSDKSLDNFYNMSKNVNIGGYAMYNRRTLTYKIIKELESLGALNGTGGFLSLAGGGDVSEWLQILSDTMREYVAQSSRWDYLQGSTRKYYNIRGKQIEARTDCTGFVTAAMKVLNLETGGSYAKEVDPWWNSTRFCDAPQVTGFQKIPFSGINNCQPGDFVVRYGHGEIIYSITPEKKVYNCGWVGFAKNGQPYNWREGNGNYKYIYRIIVKPKKKTSTNTSTAEWTWPVPNSKSISSPFGMRNGKMHNGIDIPAPAGTPIVSSRSGVVVAAGDSARFFIDGVRICGGTGYGKVTIIDHKDGYCTLYAHQSKISVSVGQVVGPATVIGAVGNTGDSYGNHLHFEVNKYSGSSNGCEHLDPTKFVSNK